jgi:hypothetical protein
MIRGMPRRHAAIQYAVFDPRSGELHIASAGMPGPFHLCADGCRSLGLAGIPPGLFEGTSYETLTIRLSPGDSVLFCTDGITDAFDRDGEPFGLERPQDLCRNQRHLSPTEILGRNFFRGSRFFARPRAARRYGSSSVPLLRLVDTPAMCSHRHVESGQKAPGMRLTALALSSIYDRYRQLRSGTLFIQENPRCTLSPLRP